MKTKSPRSISPSADARWPKWAPHVKQRSESPPPQLELAGKPARTAPLTTHHLATPHLPQIEVFAMPTEHDNAAAGAMGADGNPSSCPSGAPHCAADPAAAAAAAGGRAVLALDARLQRLSGEGEEVALPPLPEGRFMVRAARRATARAQSFRARAHDRCARAQSLRATCPRATRASARSRDRAQHERRDRSCCGARCPLL